MKRHARRLLLAATMTIPISAVCPGQELQTVDGGPVLRAMREELQRSLSLRLAALDDVYYIEYVIDDAETLSISATLGAVVTEAQRRVRIPRVQIRVGSYEFDNTNYVFSDAFSGRGRRLNQAPLGDDVTALRHHLWLATDVAYKGALEAISRKKAALEHVNLPETLPDFAKAKQVSMVLEPRKEEVDAEVWAEKMRRLSGVFADYPEINRSSVHFESIQSTSYITTTEKTLARYPESVHYVRIRAEGQAPDGMQVRDAVVVQRLSLSDMPSDLDLEKAAREVAGNVRALREAPAGESYVGPILFEKTAAAQLFAQLLDRNLAISRKPIPEPGRNVPFQPSELEGRMGARILPEWMDVVDDPTQSEWRNEPLFGHYVIDLEGIVPTPLRLVEKGILKNYLLTRQPVKGFAESNGRARLPGRYGANAATIGNLFVEASETVSESRLKRQLLEICERQGKPYGILVRKLDFPSSASISELRRITAGARGRGQGAGLVSSPILAYRVYPDGREELVRGLQFRSLPVRTLRDIIAASEESYLFNYLRGSAPLSLMGAGGFMTTCSVVAPSILIEDLELDRDADELPKLPVVPPPDLIATQ